MENEHIHTLAMEILGLSNLLHSKMGPAPSQKDEFAMEAEKLFQTYEYLMELARLPELADAKSIYHGIGVVR